MKLAMCFSSKLVAGIAATMIVCDPALAYHAEPYASAQIYGTQEKTVIHTKAPGHYIVCVEWGKYSLQLIYDTDSTDMEPGDCISVEASKISIKGKSEDEFSRAVIYDQIYRHSYQLEMR